MYLVLPKINKKEYHIFLFFFQATLGSFSCGCSIGWSSIVLPKVDPALCCPQPHQMTNCTCDLTDVPEQALSWIASLFPLGGVIAGPIAFFLLDKLGRKWTLICLCVPMLVGYSMLTLSYYVDNIAILLVGRFLTGKKYRGKGRHNCTYFCRNLVLCCTYLWRRIAVFRYLRFLLQFMTPKIHLGMTVLKDVLFIAVPLVVVFPLQALYFRIAKGP